jgi:GNAT superfamily N-acetyltransferase
VIRHATADDVDQVVAMGMAFLDEVYAEKLTAPPDPARLRTMAQWLLDDDTTRALLVSDHDGTLTGMFGLHCYQHPMTGQLTASEQFWFITPDRRGKFDGLRLLAAARAWATLAGAATLHLVAPGPTVEALYTRLGYRKIESAFVAVL